MSQYWVALGFTALPALGNFAGGLIAKFFRLSNIQMEAMFQKDLAHSRKISLEGWQKHPFM